MSAIPMTACEWRVGPPCLSQLRIVERPQRDGSIRYAVTWLGRVANKGREWEWEPLPSSRDDDFIARTRFEDWEDAAYVAQHMGRELMAQGELCEHPGSHAPSASPRSCKSKKPPHSWSPSSGEGTEE